MKLSEVREREKKEKQLDLGPDENEKRDVDSLSDRWKPLLSINEVSLSTKETNGLAVPGVGTRPCDANGLPVPICCLLPQHYSIATISAA